MVQSEAKEAAEREVQRSYWKSHTPDHPTVETMMLDSKAKTIDAMERPEVQCWLSKQAFECIRLAC